MSDIRFLPRILDAIEGIHKEMRLIRKTLELMLELVEVYQAKVK